MQITNLLSSQTLSTGTSTDDIQVTETVESLSFQFTVVQSSETPSQAYLIVKDDQGRVKRTALVNDTGVRRVLVDNIDGVLTLSIECLMGVCRVGLDRLDEVTEQQDTFIGRSGAQESPTYTSSEIVTQSGTLEAAIGELDAALDVEGDEINDGDTFMGRGVGETAPTYTSALVVTPGTPLEQAVSELDAAHGHNYIHIEDQKTPAGTDGGTFTSGAWRTRDLNTIVSDDNSLVVSLSTNQITLVAGTYRVDAWCPAFEVDDNQVRLQNITAASTLLLGKVGRAFNDSGSAIGSYHLHVGGKVTVAASQVLELQHRGSDNKTDFGFGIGANFGTEIFSTIEFVKLS